MNSTSGFVAGLTVYLIASSITSVFERGLEAIPYILLSVFSGFIIFLACFFLLRKFLSVKTVSW